MDLTGMVGDSCVIRGASRISAREFSCQTVATSADSTIRQSLVTISQKLISDTHNCLDSDALRTVRR